jgi:ABC-type nitrate/sulfonate/bicarbonate transport system substrate-binding protein
MTVTPNRATAIAALLSILIACPVSGFGDERDESAVPIRIGWQIPAVTQAGIVQVLKRTDVMAKRGIEPRLVPYSFGTPEIEAALAGKLDVFFAGDQPAINLLTRGGKWKIVARLYYDRIAIVVPPDSPVSALEELRGKQVASPFGSVAHREALLGQRSAGLDPNTDVENVDMDILDISDRIRTGGIENWGDMDAAAIWEPTVSAFRHSGLTRNLSEKLTLGVVAMSDEFVARNPEAATQLLVALTQAWHFFARNPERVLRWYIDDTQLEYTQEALLDAVSIDPNFHVQSLRDIGLELDEDLIATLEKHAAWSDTAWEDGSRIRQFVDQSLLSRARQEIADGHFEELKVILPSIRTVESLRKRTDFGLDSISLGVMFTFMTLIVLLSIEAGLWLGRRSHKTVEADSVRPVATLVGAVLGMMAFVIALTFGSATNRFDARKTALLEDVTAIQTAYLRADLLQEPHRTTVRSLLRDYVQVRAGIVHAYGDPDRLQLVQRRATALQKDMWSHVEAMVAADGNTRMHTFFAAALNDVFKLHTKRVVLGAYYRIPGFLWWALIVASCVAMVAVGFQFGIGGRRRILTANVALALTFALVMVLAFDLDRAGEGMIAVNQQPMIDLYQSMSGPN